MNSKTTILICGFILTTISIGFAQTKEQELSNAEKFSAKAGTLIQTEFIEVGKVKGAEIKVVHFTDLINNTRQSALEFEYESVESIQIVQNQPF